jgi:hypothetical protein
LTTALLGVAPLPVRQGATVRYALAVAGDVELAVYDVNGRMVRRLESGHREAGLHSLAWDGTDAEGRLLASGAYWCVFRAGGIRSQAKMLIAR